MKSRELIINNTWNIFMPVHVIKSTAFLPFCLSTLPPTFSFPSLLLLISPSSTLFLRRKHSINVITSLFVCRNIRKHTVAWCLGIQYVPKVWNCFSFYYYLVGLESYCIYCCWQSGHGQGSFKIKPDILNWKKSLFYQYILSISHRIRKKLLSLVRW